MEPVRSTYEVMRGKKRESVEVSKVENGYIVRHWGIECPSKEYVAKTQEEVEKIVKDCLGDGAKKLEEKPESVLRGISTPYEAAY